LKFQGYLLDILGLIGSGLQRDIITDQYVKDFHDQIHKDFQIKAHDIELEDIVDNDFCGTEKKSDRSIPGNTLLTHISKLTAKANPEYANIERILFTVIKKLLNSTRGNTKFKFTMCRYSIVGLLLAIADYLSEAIPRPEDHSKILDLIFEIVYRLAADNNIGKAQIFKGHGARHLFNMIARNLPQPIIMCIQLTKEVNIGAYVAKNCFTRFANHYETLIKYIHTDFDKSSRQDFNQRYYTNMILMNRFFDNLFKKTFINERQRIANMLVLQHKLYKTIAKVFIPRGIDILEDPQMRQISPDDLIDRKEILNTGKEKELYFWMENEKQN
jgi:hypothetical protein